jgi:hypothetical protein
MITTPLVIKLFDSLTLTALSTECILLLIVPCDFMLINPEDYAHGDDVKALTNTRVTTGCSRRTAYC